jgi:stage II sporulation protein GA (sporulation sigma-E factor processing peptidase)
MPVVYVDLLLLVNLTMNMLVLWATARFAQQAVSMARLFLGAALGAIYALLALFPDLHFLFSLPGKILFSLIMIGVALQPRSLTRLFSLAGYFYATSFVIAGAYLAVSLLGRGQPGIGPTYFYLDGLHWGVLAIAVALSLAMGRPVIIALRRGLQKAGCLTVEIVLGERRATVQALIDTGNRLRDPFCALPVMIVEAGAVEALFPPAAKCLLHMEASQALAEGQWAGLARWRILPFSSLGNRSGLLLGFSPDAVLIQEGTQIFPACHLVIGICRETLSPEGRFRALLPPEALATA